MRWRGGRPPALRRARPPARAASRSRPWATVATRAGWAAGHAWLPMPRKSAVVANSQTCPAGVASSSATPSTRTSIAAATTVLRAPRPSAYCGHARQTHDDADRHGDAGSRRGQPQHRHPVEQQKGPQQAGAERVHGQGDGITGASGGTDEGARLDLGGGCHGVNDAFGRRGRLCRLTDTVNRRGRRPSDQRE
jgi:hypothetical protein